MGLFPLWVGGDVVEKVVDSGMGDVGRRARGSIESSSSAPQARGLTRALGR
jgi:hypothetical protein